MTKGLRWAWGRLCERRGVSRVARAREASLRLAPILGADLRTPGDNYALGLVYLRAGVPEKALSALESAGEYFAASRRAAIAPTGGRSSATSARRAAPRSWSGSQTSISPGVILQERLRTSSKPRA